jgi:hypothetical protein
MTSTKIGTGGGEETGTMPLYFSKESLSGQYTSCKILKLN